MRFRIIFLFFILTFSNQIIAQTRLTLEETIRLALENNHDFKQVKIENKKAEEQVREAYGSSLFPSIDGRLNYSRALKRPEFIFEAFGETQRIQVGTANSLTAGVTVEQPLFSGAMFLAVKIAETYSEISARSVKYTEAELIKRTKESYYTYLLVQELINLAELQLERAEKNLRNTQSMFDAGLASDYDVMRANLEKQNLIPQVSSAKNQLNQAANNIRLLTGLSENEEIIIEDSLEYIESELPSFEDGLYTVLNNNELVKQKELETKMQDLVASYEFTQHLPKINAFGNWQTQAQEEDDRGFGDWRYRNSITVGVELSLPIFKGFTIDSKVEQAELDLKIAQEGLSKVKKETRNQYENLRLTINSTREQINAYQVGVKEAERGYEIAVKRYESGLGTQLEIADALYQSTLAKVNLLQSIHSYIVSMAELDVLMGKTIEELTIK